MSDLDSHIDSATQALLARPQADGHFLFELEADATIPAEYVLLRHYLAEPVDAELGLDVPTERRDRPCRNVLSNSFAFGGSNVSLLFGAPEPGPEKGPA